MKLESSRGRSRWAWFAAGSVVAAAGLYAALWLGGYTVVSREGMAEQKLRLTTLENENRELTDDQFRFGALLEPPFGEDDLPYAADVDAASMVAEARVRAERESKFLMVTFGANWCLDCRTLHRRLQSKGQPGMGPSSALSEAPSPPRSITG